MIPGEVTSSRTRKLSSALLNEVINRIAGAPGETIDTAVAVARRLVEMISSLGDEVPTEQEVLGFGEAMRFFVANKSRARGATSGAVLRTRDRSRQLIRLLYLDAGHNPVPGAPMALYSVAGVDEELGAAFGPHDLILVD